MLTLLLGAARMEEIPEIEYTSFLQLNISKDKNKVAKESDGLTHSNCGDYVDVKGPFWETCRAILRRDIDSEHS